MKIGLQLYSVREDMERDFAGTLRAVKDMGYDCVEFAGYCGRTAEQVRELLDKIGLDAPGVHQSHDVFLNSPLESVAYLQTIGAKYSAIPWVEQSRFSDAEDFERLVREVVLAGALLKAHGITLLYHNHDFEFVKNAKGNYYIDELYNRVGSDLLHCEIDTCWVKYAGVDPAEYILKYAGRCPIVHLKDFVGRKSGAPAYALIDSSGKASSDSVVSSEFCFKPLGQGVQDFASIIAASKKAGTGVLIVEQDESPEKPALVSARQSIEYLQKLI